MRKVINRHAYDTNKSQLIAVTDNGVASECLYRTQTGHYFLVRYDPNPEPIDEIIILTEADAVAEYNKLLLKNPRDNPAQR